MGEKFIGTLIGNTDKPKHVKGTKKSGIYCEVITDTTRFKIEFHKNGEAHIHTEAHDNTTNPVVTLNDKSVANKLHR